MIGQRVHGDRARILRGAREGLARGEILEQRHPARRDHALGGFGHDAVHAADLARLDAHRVIGDVEVGFLDESVAFENESEVLGPERLAGTHDAGQQVVQHVIPDFAPRLAPRQSQRGRMLGAEHRAIGVVVEDGELGTPEQDDLGP